MANSDHAIPAAELDAKIIELKSDGHTFQQIADELGYSSRGYIYGCYQRALAAIREPAVAEYRTKQLAAIAARRVVAEEILNASHPLVSNGKRFDDLEDDGPRLAAIDRLEKLDDREARLLNLYPPTKIHADVTSRVELVGIDTEQL